MGGWTPPDGAATQLILVRHGATVHSPERRFSGRNDLPLSPQGEAQAAALASRGYPPITAVVCSPLRRTVQTAAAIADPLGLPVETVDDLVETDFGAWEGSTFAQVRERWPDELSAWSASPEVAPPGGESFAAVTERVERARASVLARHRGGRVVVVSHVTPIKTLLRLAVEAPPVAMYRIHLDTASVSIITYAADDTASVLLVNDTGHLPR